MLSDLTIDPPIRLAMDSFKSVHRARLLLRDRPIRFASPEHIAALLLLQLHEMASKCLDIEGFELRCEVCGGDEAFGCRHCVFGLYDATPARLEAMNCQQLEDIVEQLEELGAFETQAEAA